MADMARGIKIEDIQAWTVCEGDHWHPVLDVGEPVDQGKLALHGAILGRLVPESDALEVSLTPQLAHTGGFHD